MKKIPFITMILASLSIISLPAFGADILKRNEALSYKGPFVSSYEKTHEEGLKQYKPPSLSLESSSVPSGAAQAGAALVTSIVLHEGGHALAAYHAGAKNVSLKFLQKNGGKFYLGLANYEGMDDKAKVPYSMGGEFAADLTFEYALQSYKDKPSVYNKTLLVLSGTDFLRYCVYSFYLTKGNDSSYYDPVVVARETGISKDALFAVALAKTAINAYRVYSGNDRIIPYFTVDKNSAVFNLMTAF